MHEATSSLAPYPHSVARAGAISIVSPSALVPFHGAPPLCVRGQMHQRRRLQDLFIHTLGRHLRIAQHQAVPTRRPYAACSLSGRATMPYARAWAKGGWLDDYQFSVSVNKLHTCC